MEAFVTEKQLFEELYVKISETSERLAEEREKVLEEKQIFDDEKEKLDHFKHEIDVERSILQSDFAKAEELEHELTHRENMLKMLQFNHDRKGLGAVGEGPLPVYTSCPSLKNEKPQAAENRHQVINNNESGYYNFQQSPQQFESFRQQPSQPYASEKRFNYNQYIMELEKKLGENRLLNQSRVDNNTGSNDEYTNEFGYRSGNSRLNASGVSATGTGFREKILARLGNAHLEDSMVNSQPEDFNNADFLSAQKIHKAPDVQQ